ncbi:MAG: HD domain-containing protein [Acidobacteriaceae bacterium]
MSGVTARGAYERRMAEIRGHFESNGDGLRAIAARSDLVDELVLRFWADEVRVTPALGKGIALCAIGGYGRRHLFPCSDVDLLFCVEKGMEKPSKDPIRRLSQSLWDCGLHVSPAIRMPKDCERLDEENPEFALSLLDIRWLGGDDAIFSQLEDKSLAKLRSRDGGAIGVALSRLTLERHAKFGDTLFHLEPNIKDSPGGLRDVNACQWLYELRTGKRMVLSDVAGERASLNGQRSVDRAHGDPFQGGELRDAVAFLAAVRCFLHYRHERDDNTLDWETQDVAARQRIGLAGRTGEGVDAAYWMRVYFRHARLIDKRLLREAEISGLEVETPAVVKRLRIPDDAGFRIRAGVLELEQTRAGRVDVAQEPEIVLAAFRAMAESGAVLAQSTEDRIVQAIPFLSANLEEGPGLWQALASILTGRQAGRALRAMHSLGVLELILPEFHGIDALVIRDAYHRYTVDEHTFVLIDTLHGMAAEPVGVQRKGRGKDVGKDAVREPRYELEDWRVRFGAILAELQNPALLFLAALLHDTGKGRVGTNHAAESVGLARSVLQRLEMDAYESAMVVRLIEMHLEMSAAMRRDIFDAETVRAFAGRVQTHELLRMLTLFTYADIAAVHPDALTPWKAEGLWRLYMGAANQLDRRVDEERVHARSMMGGIGLGRKDEKIASVLALVPGREAELEHFLEGFPERYVSTRSAETMLQHFEMTRRFDEDPFQMSFHHGATQTGSVVNEITLVTLDRPRLFAGIAAALAAWGMNVVTAEAFANHAGVVVDTFRFTDTFRTLELNESERGRFLASVQDLVAGRTPVEKLLSGRRRPRRKAPRVYVDTRIEFDETASTHSTLLQVVAQDVYGLLRAISATLSDLGYNVEVALVDTEGETAIDVFYLTSRGRRLTLEQETELRAALLSAIETNNHG